MFKKILLPLLILIFAATSFGDIARPDKSPKSVKKPTAVDAYLSIKLDRNAKEAKLIIPRSQIKALRAELESMDEDGTTAAVGGISRVQTIVSGAFISLALVFAGVWFVRSGRLSTSTGKAVAAVLLIAVTGAMAAVVYGNAGPPAEARSITGKMFSQAVHIYKFGGGRIKLEVTDTEENLQMIVPDPESPPKPGE